MPHIKEACYDRTRLYFLVYLCDHHCSLSHGRPPLTRDFHSLKSPGAFLQSRFSVPADLKLISQIELWSISGRVFDIFGADIESSMASHRSTELERLSSAYDRWRQDWLSVLLLKQDLDKASERVFDLYFYSAKLYLFSHIFRGPTQEVASLSAESNAAAAFARSAVESALSIVHCIVGEHEAQPWLEKLPLYFGTMIAFASVCLLRILHQRQTLCDVEKNEISGYLHQLVEVLDTSLMVDHPTHPLPSIAKSLAIAASGQQWASNNHTNRDLDENFDFGVFTNADDTINMSVFRDQDQWLSFPGL